MLKNLNLNNFKNKNNFYKSLGERGLKVSGSQIQWIKIKKHFVQRIFITYIGLSH